MRLSLPKTPSEPFHRPKCASSDWESLHLQPPQQLQSSDIWFCGCIRRRGDDWGRISSLNFPSSAQGDLLRRSRVAMMQDAEVW